ncbi:MULTISPECIES: type II secretion system protein [unclassified Lysobacter]
MNRKTGGWSLVELAVVLMVMGVLGLALWQTLPLAPKVAAGDSAGRDLARAEQALLGYALAHSQLPAPVNEDGLGVLPTEMLGLPSQLKLRYQVQSSLTAPGSDFKLSLPLAFGLGGPPPAPQQVNGLDFCMRLKSAHLATLDGMNGVPTAFALMHPGQAGHDQLSATAEFVLPGSPGAAGRRVLAIGPGEFASRLACPDRVARARGAAHAAYTAYDLAQIAREYKDFRTFAIQVAKMNKANADTGVAFAAFDVVYGVFTEMIAILQEAAGWPPDPFGIATGIVSHVAATVQLGLAIAAVATAAIDLDSAIEDVETAKDQETAATANLDRMTTLANQSLLRAQHLDEQGLQP